MPNEKMENLLNLALAATQEEREKSLELDIGYDSAEQTWEVIVKFVGTTEELEALLFKNFPEEYPRIQLTNLQNEYAVLVLPEHLVEPVAALDKIEYMEKPKLLFFAVDNGKRASCITQLQERTGLSGAGVLVAVIDSGIDYAHPDFRRADGTTRIVSLWDQTIPASGGLSAPAGYFLGTEYDEARINEALAQPTEQQRYAVCPSRDASGHGTHVAGIAAGNGRASEGRYRGVAYESDLLIVKLGNQREGAFPRTTELMQAVDYCLRKAQERQQPVAINLSFGNNYGSHTGTSLIETYLDDLANYWKSSIVIGSGNEGAAATHTAGALGMGQAENVEFAVSAYESALNLQIWKSYADEMAVLLIHPGGMQIGPIRQIQGPQRFTLGQTQILLYYGEPSPYSPYQEIYLDFLPVRDYVDSGIWTVRLIPQRIVTGRYDMWFPAGGVLNEGKGDYGRGVRREVRAAGGIFRQRIYRKRTGQAGSCGAGRGDHLLRAGRRLYGAFRNFDGNPVCDGERGTSDGMGDCARKRCVPVRRKNKGVPDPRSASARRRKGFWSAAGISESAGGVGNFMFVGQSAGVGKREEFRKRKKKIT